MTRHGGDASIADLIVAMDERAALAAIRRRLEAGETPVKLISECVNGIERVGRLYKDGTFFISALIMAGEIFREAAEILIPLLEQPARLTNAGNFIIATVKGDIHDIGKNLVGTMLSSSGFKVIDLGTDVPAEEIVKAVRDNDAQAVGLSVLLTSMVQSIGEVVRALDAAGLRSNVKVAIGGACTTQELCDKMGADALGRDAVEAVRIFEGFCK